MTLGDIIQQAVQRDLAGQITKNGLVYTEMVKGNRFCIKLSSTKHPEATLECSVPYNGLPEEENYARLHFLSMAFNSAIYGMKRKFSKSKS
jgi:hypothetical protein